VNSECRLADGCLIGKYDFFIVEVAKAHVDKSPKHPETLHCTGDGEFMVSRKFISRRSDFRPEMLLSLGRGSASVAAREPHDRPRPGFAAAGLGAANRCRREVRSPQRRFARPRASHEGPHPFGRGIAPDIARSAPHQTTDFVTITAYAADWRLGVRAGEHSGRGIESDRVACSPRHDERHPAPMRGRPPRVSRSVG
jgi:hypothetical protein